MLGLVVIALALLSVPVNLSGQAAKAPARAARPAPRPPNQALSPDTVLAWRDLYGDLVGKSKDVAIERYGKDYVLSGSWYEWSASDKTGFRDVWVMSAAVVTGGADKVWCVRVFPRPFEGLDVILVLKKATLFTFTSGTFSNSTKSFFDAASKAGNTTIRFAIEDWGLYLESVSFT